MGVYFCSSSRWHEQVHLHCFQSCFVSALNIGLKLTVYNPLCRYSIFFRLPYWTHLKINHLLDPMHIFKNVGSSIWEHIIGRRDNVSVREDLRVAGRMRQAWPREEDGHVRLPPAPWIISKKEEKQVKQAITTLRTPTGCMRSLKGAFTTTKKRGVEQLYGLKSHDWHKMLQVSVLYIFVCLKLILVIPLTK